VRLAAQRWQALTSSSLKSAALLDLMKKHLASPDGEELKTKVGFVSRIDIAPKVREAPCSAPSASPTLMPAAGASCKS